MAAIRMNRKVLPGSPIVVPFTGCLNRLLGPWCLSRVYWCVLPPRGYPPWRLGAGIEPKSFLGIRDHERPALLKISQQRAAGGCSSEVLERMPAQNGAR
jgi:hypothetical protein